MPARFTELIVDCKDPHLLGGFWQQVLAWEVSERADDYLELTNPEHPYPTLLFGRVPDENTPWVVLAVPEGNEFCILRTPRP